MVQACDSIWDFNEQTRKSNLDAANAAVSSITAAVQKDYSSLEIEFW